MNKKLRWITETAVMLALLLAFQWLGSYVSGKIAKQIVTGSLVNCVLAVSVLYIGYGSGITIALISPIFAFFLGINQNPLAIAPIMVGNVCFVVLLRLICGKTGKPFWKQPIAWLTAAVTKYGVMHALAVWLMCDLLGPTLTSAGIMTAKLNKQLLMAFDYPQLIAALVGGALALAIWPVLRKALKK
jgi:small basic protein